MIVNVLDPKLPWLASNAAVELDLLINGEPVQLVAVKELGGRLRQALDKPAPDQPARRLNVDTATETVLGQAIMNMNTGADPATVLGELLHRMEQISGQLSAAETGTERSSLELLRAFCLALSQSAAAYRQSVIDVRPPHPYRR